MVAPRAYPRDEIRRWDRLAWEKYGLPGIVLMENAGSGAARLLDALASGGSRPCLPPYLILCGPGNNGGDGLVVARHLHNMERPVEVLAAGKEAFESARDAALNFEVVRRMGIPGDLERLKRLPPAQGLAGYQAGTLVDALFGTGLSRPLRAPYLQWVQAINARGLPVVSLDVPSGLDADSGEELGAAVRADHTITFAARKLGFEGGKGREAAGIVHVIDIGIPRELIVGPPMADS